MKINPEQSKYDYMLESSKDNMESVALTFGKRKITYEELHESIDKYAKMLYAKGVRKGDVVGISVLNSPEAVYLVYALDKLGAITVGYNPFDNKEKTRKDIELTKPKMIITADFSYGNYKNLDKSLEIAPMIYSPITGIEDKKIKFGYKMLQIAKGNFTLRKEDRLEDFIQGDFSGIVLPASNYQINTLSDILFTGGSTGVHKGVDLASNGINSLVEGEKYMVEDGYLDGKTYLGNIPLGHMAFGRLIMHIALTNKMIYALTLKAMPNDFYDELVRTQAHAAAGGPPHWTSLIEKKDGIYVPRSDLKPGTLVNLDLATSGGEAKKKSTEDAINAALHFCGCKSELGDGLGATETWATNTLSNCKTYRKGTLGSPISTIEFKLVDPETGKVVEKGERGVLHVSGPTVMLGYHNNPEETEKVMYTDENGKKWLILGDYLQEVDDNVYKYVGRQKRNFVSGCDNVYPEQIEDLLTKMPEVREAVVTAIPDDIQQYIPSYHISLYSDDIDFGAFEKKMSKAVSTNATASALPGRIEYFTEPLKRMTNSKVDLAYYQQRDKELESSPKVKTLKK